MTLYFLTSKRLMSWVPRRGNYWQFVQVHRFSICSVLFTLITRSMLKPEIIHFGKMSLVSRCYEICAIKYSENKVMMHFGLSEPGILESNVFKQIVAYCLVVDAFKQIVACCLVFDGVPVVWNSCRVMLGLLDTWLKHSRSNLVIEIRYNFILGMLFQSFKQRQNNRIYPFTWEKMDLCYWISY